MNRRRSHDSSPAARRATGLLGAALLLGANPLAPAATAQETFTLPPIIVSGGLAPIAGEAYGRAGSVLTAAQIEARGLATVQDALRALPGVSVSSAGTSNTQVRIRGAEANHTLILIDGVEAAGGDGEYFLSGLETANIERIEVLRGPQSVFFGSNASAGVVNIVTRAGAARSEGAGLRAGGAVEAGRGWAASGFASVRGAQGGLALGLAARDDEGFDASGSGGEKDGTDRRTLTFSEGLGPQAKPSPSASHCASPRRTTRSTAPISPPPPPRITSWTRPARPPPARSVAARNLRGARRAGHPHRPSPWLRAHRIRPVFQRPFLPSTNADRGSALQAQLRARRGRPSPMARQLPHLPCRTRGKTPPRGRPGLCPLQHLRRAGVPGQLRYRARPCRPGCVSTTTRSSRMPQPGHSDFSTRCPPRAFACTPRPVRAWSTPPISSFSRMPSAMSAIPGSNPSATAALDLGAEFPFCRRAGCGGRDALRRGAGARDRRGRPTARAASRS